MLPTETGVDVSSLTLDPVRAVLHLFLVYLRGGSIQVMSGWQHITLELGRHDDRTTPHVIDCLLYDAYHDSTIRHTSNNTSQTTRGINNQT